MSGAPYPELAGTFNIISSSGFTSEISFSGKGWVRGEKNSFHATIFRTDDSKKTPVYTAKGQWSERFAFFDSTGTEIDSFDALAAPTAPLSIPSIKEQDPWETRRAWAPTTSALERGDFAAVVAEKAKVENAQRRLRKAERQHGVKWEPEFFKQVDADRQVEALSALVKELDEERLIGSTGAWRFDFAREEERRKRGERGRGVRDGTSPLE
jgi:oxysterol-binding protein-related protein 9/10/11